ncbi:MAG: NADH-quinone oxidoreductase subunit L [Chloroflexi bacterium]|nr:NADH-quinone oxidoreductase subunit L [Chloroflexota bacterium]OJV91773.1 MAG: hypothetical protein BGO39_17935 [Chloroflexi bacterium 54-19]
MNFALLSVLGPFAALGLILIVRRASAVIALAGAILALIGAITGFLSIALANSDPVNQTGLLLPGLPGFPLRLVFEPLSVLLILIVAGVSLLVLVYAVGYLAEDEGKPRFYLQMSLFSGAMQLLVLAGDWLLLLAAWELIGLASYLLIGFWYKRKGVASAATRAFLTTRAADLGLYLGIFLLVSQTGSTEISRTLQIPTGSTPAILAGLLLLVAAMGKAGQVPFQGWLQDAMAGPTPVSALLHSATLVAAGAILLIKVYPLMPPEVLLVVGLAGGVTALVTGVMALLQRDLKRLLASSTSSQLGFMFLAVGAGSVGAATVHLLTHAAMKSALFLAAGILQHAYDSTSFDELAGSGRKFRRTFAAFCLAGLALAGVPPLAGFWSKDSILAATFSSPFAPVLAPLGLLGTFLTAAYIARAIRLLWQGQPKTKEDFERGSDQNSESSGSLPEPKKVAGLKWMGGALGVMAAFTVILGLAVEPGASFTGQSLPSDFVSLGAGLLAVALGLVAGWVVNSGKFPAALQKWAGDGFRLKNGFGSFVVTPALALARLAALLETGLQRLVQGIGKAGLSGAGLAGQLETLLGRGISGVGRSGMMLARLAQLIDDRGISSAISALVKGIRSLGGRVRRLQSGLIHREMALTALGAGFIMVFFLLFR